VVELINKFVVLVRLRRHSAVLTESGGTLLMGKGCVHSAIDWNVKEAFHPARMTPFARGCFSFFFGLFEMGFTDPTHRC
jgi:hypothetical protein